MTSPPASRPVRRTNCHKRFRCRTAYLAYQCGWSEDRGYTSHAFREHVWSMGAKPAIPPQRHEASVACPDWIYNNRNVVERLWARLKEWRAVATRYEKTASSFMGILCLAAALDWIKS